MNELIEFIGSGGFDNPECIVRIMTVVIVCDFLAMLVKNMLASIRG